MEVKNIVAPVALEYASKELQADKEIVWVAVKEDGEALAYASKKLQAEKEIVMAPYLTCWIFRYPVNTSVLRIV